MTTECYTYAKFWKCALQVNSHAYGGQYRGRDHGMDARSYAEALRDVCREEDIRVVGLADHGSIADADVAREVLRDAEIVVFPGFEVATTEKVHWVCLFPEDTDAKQLERYLGELGLTDPEDGARPSRHGGSKILLEVERLGGFCYAAHATSNSGVLKGKFNNLWKDSRLRAAQIPGHMKDLPHEYKQIARNQDPGYQRDRPVALINAKDVAEPEDLRDPHASVLVKMTRPCFSSFLMAFTDPESRIRLAGEEETNSYSQIDDIAIEGGYFDGLSVRMSSHLNAMIGGRGTGKSTLIECVRYALDIAHKGEEAKRQGDQIVKANLGDAGGRVILKLRSAENHGRAFRVIRRYGEPPRVLDEQGNESRLHPGRDLLPSVEVYGQNEIYELAKRPDALTRVLDRFLPEGAEQASRLEMIYRKLEENSDKLAKTRDRQEGIEQRIAQLPRLEEQARQFREQGLEEKLKQVPLLEKERQLRPRIRSEIERVRGGQRELKESLPDLVFLGDRALNPLPHAEPLRRVRQILDALNATLHQKLVEIDQAIDDADAALQRLDDELRQAIADAEGGLEKEFAKLPSIAGQDGREVGRGYQQLLRQIEEVSPAKAEQGKIKALVESLEQDRRNLLGEISDMRSARTAAKKKEIKRLNKRLADKLQIHLTPDGLRQPLRGFLQNLPRVGESRTAWVDEARELTIPAMVAAIREGKDALRGRQDAWGLTPGMIDALVRMTPEQLCKLEGIDLEERIELELNVSHAQSEPAYRPLARLSTGQQCTAILHLLLLDNRDPLIMDQPEDNLDNAFIAERIVQELRAAKTQRQFLFATHNANIPVFGDAEWIGVCAASGDQENQAVMPETMQGSIDMPSIRNQVANLLEGGREAFMQRREKYGFDYPDVDDDDDDD